SLPAPLPCSCALLDHSEKLPANLGVVAEAPEHAACDEARILLVHAARGHAVMHRFDHNADTVRFEFGIDCIGNLGRQLFLNLQTSGESLDNAGELADTDDAAAWNIGDPSAAEDWRHMVLAMAFEGDVAQHDHLIIAVDLVERLLQDGGWIF